MHHYAAITKSFYILDLCDVINDLGLQSRMLCVLPSDLGKTKI